MNKSKKLPKNIICVAIAAIIIGFITLICASGQIAYEVADNFECWRPDYEMQDISPILDKDNLKGEDYSLLYKQTGLTKIGIDRALAKGDKELILEIQEAYFAKHKVEHYKFAPYICTCNIGQDFIPNIYLEEGDIIVSSSTQFFGWRMGHAGLVTAAYGVNGDILQATAVGNVSHMGDIGDFTSRITFMIFSPRTDKATKQKVVNYASENLVGLYYNPLQGVFNSKNSIETTQCSHLVWYAYNKFGIDLDYNGGGIVTPKDLANSPKMELVQVFGFDPNKLWK